MFIFKYALKSISRSLGRNILIGIIVFIIATAACVAMSIQQAAETSSDKLRESKTVTASIGVSKSYISNIFKTDASETQTKTEEEKQEMAEEAAEKIGELTLELDDLQKYAKAKAVKNFYYYSTISVDGADGFYAVNSTKKETETEDATESATEATTAAATGPGGETVPTPQQMPETPESVMQKVMSPGELTLKGYSSEDAMEEFQDGTYKMTEGEVFTQNTKKYECVMDEYLATNNSVSVGDKIKFKNPKNEDETYTFTIVGLFENTQSQATNSTAASDPSNTILTSYEVVKKIESKSDETNSSSSSDSKSSDSKSSDSKSSDSKSSDSKSDDDDDEDEDDSINSTVTGTYVLANANDYDLFLEQTKEMGLDQEKYFIISADVASFEASMLPLNNLKSFATTFLYITLLIGAIVLVVISIISIRDRKYEIGALAAMGLKKLKLSMMFMIEILTVTLIAILIGCVVGSAVSVPITDTLLASQIEQEKKDSQELQTNFGKPVGGSSTLKGGEYNGEIEYTDSVEFSVNIFVILRMLAIGIGLAVISGFTSIFFILRYDPKQILASRD